MNSRGKRKKKESDIKSVLLIIAAAVVVIAAIYIVVNVVGKIKDDYESLEFTKKEESTVIDIKLKKEEELGWNESDGGWKYLLKKDKYAANQWIDIDGFLYYFGEDTYMVTGELKQDGQIFKLHDTKGYLKDIQKDWNYVPQTTGDNLESIVKTNAFWYFLKEPEEGNNSPFKVIQYRKTVDNKIMVLGDVSNPQKTTNNSMKAYGDYLYFLPKVKDSQMHLLSQDEQMLCNKLFRMIPGSDSKELIADNVDGYIVVNNVIFYSQKGNIFTATSGIEYTERGIRYSVIIENDNCYLVDSEGNPAFLQEGNSVTIGDRLYQIENDGKIFCVKRAQPVVGGNTYYLSGNRNNSAVSIKTQEGDRIIIKESYGVQSYCIVDKEIYFSAYVDKDENGQWYSQIFKTNLEGKNKNKVSERFPGCMEVMYYYEDEGEIYGEYFPALWEQAYGQIVVITLNGSIYKIEDESVRTGRSVDGNDRLQLLMVKDGKLTALWQNCSWSKTAGVTGILWSKGIELDSSLRSILKAKTKQTEAEKETEDTEEEDIIIRPLDPSAPAQPDKTIDPIQPSVKQDTVIGTDGPKSETTVSTTAPKATEDVVEIIPLG